MCAPRNAGSPSATQNSRASFLDVPSSPIMSSLLSNFRPRCRRPKLQITSFPYLFTSFPPYIVFDSRYNSSAIPASAGLPCRRSFLAHVNRRLPMAQNVAAEQLAITDWVKGLAAMPAREFTLQNVQDYVVRHAVLPETLDRYSYFPAACHTRNLISRKHLFC